MLLELQGSSEMKAGVSAGHEHVSPEPDRAFMPFHPIQFITHAVCVHVRNNLCCCKTELCGPIFSLCTHLSAFLTCFFSQAIFRNSDAGKQKVCFQYLMLDSWPLLLQSLALTHTNPAQGTAQTLFNHHAYNDATMLCDLILGDSFMSIAPFGACSEIAWIFPLVRVSMTCVCGISFPPPFCQLERLGCPSQPNELIQVHVGGLMVQS